MKAQSKTIQDALGSIEQINDRMDTIEQMLSDLSEQIGRLHEEVTGVEGGPGGRFAPYSIEDIGMMLSGLQRIFEREFAAKAFELFDLEANHIKQIERFAEDETFSAALLKMTVGSKLGLRAKVLDQLYEEWKTLGS